MSRRSAELKTTSYAMLGMLAIRPWTSYELAQHMDRGIGRLWPPSARSNLFVEPKKLVALGLAESRQTPLGNRPRTEYSITEEGRAALREWLAAPGEPTRIASEQLLQFFFVENGTSEQARRLIDAIRTQALEHAAENVAVARSYLEGTGPFPDRAAILAVVGRFMADFTDMVVAWSQWAGEVVAEWPNDPRMATPAWDALEDVAARNAPSP